MIALLLLAASDPALDALFAAPPAPPSCSVTLTVDVREAAGEAPERQVYAYDREADAWTYVTQDGETPPDAEADEAEDEADDRTLPAAYYAEALGRSDLAWAPVEGSPGLYRADDLPDGEVEMSGRDMSSRLALEYQVTQTPEGPRLVTDAARLKEAFRVPFIARVDALSIERDYAPAGPETGAPGAMLPTHERIMFRGDVTGQARDSLITTEYGGWDCVPAE